MPTHIGSVDRTLIILEAVVRSPDGVTLSQLSEDLGIRASTLHNFLRTLVRMGYLSQAYSRGPYTRGPKLFELAEVISRDTRDLTVVAQRPLQRLHRTINETIHLSVLVGKEAVDAQVLESDQMLRFSTTIGHRLPLHASAAGKTLLAWLDEEDTRLLLQGALTSYTDRTITDIDKLLEELQRIRENGYALNIGELDANIRCIAAPISDATGQVISALSVSTPDVRFPGETVLQLRDDVLQAAGAITKSLSPLSQAHQREELSHTAPIADVSHAGADRDGQADLDGDGFGERFEEE